MTMMMTTALGTLLTTHQGLSLTTHTLDPLRAMMMTGATQAVQVVIVKASTTTTTGIGSISLVLLPRLHPAPRLKEERQKVAKLALRAERAMPMVITTRVARPRVARQRRPQIRVVTNFFHPYLPI